MSYERARCSRFPSSPSSPVPSALLRCPRGLSPVRPRGLSPMRPRGGPSMPPTRTPKVPVPMSTKAPKTVEASIYIPIEDVCTVDDGIWRPLNPDRVKELEEVFLTGQ